MLGRRWFLVMGSLICAIGHLIVGVAKNSNTIIAGMAVTGFGAALCQMATFALTELLPNKWRHIGMNILFTVHLVSNFPRCRTSGWSSLFHHYYHSNYSPLRILCWRLASQFLFSLCSPVPLLSGPLLPLLSTSAPSRYSIFSSYP
jgi:MFS family permease